MEARNIHFLRSLGIKDGEIISWLQQHIDDISVGDMHVHLIIDVHPWGKSSNKTMYRSHQHIYRLSL